MLGEILRVFYATLAFVSAAMVCEIVAPQSGRRSIRFGGLGVTLFSVACISALVPAFQISISTPAIVAIPALGWLGVLFVLLLTDFVAYWLHRAQHRWFWRFHAVHHAPREMRVHLGALGHPVEAVLRIFLAGIPLSFIDTRLIAVPTAIIVFRRFLEFYIHAETSAHLGPLGRVLVDNRFHRLHHGRAAQYRDCNFGITFSFWDSMFGTAKWPADDEWPEVGVEEYLPAQNPWQFLIHPWSARGDDPIPQGQGARNTNPSTPVAGRSDACQP